MILFMIIRFITIMVLIMGVIWQKAKKDLHWILMEALIMQGFRLMVRLRTQSFQRWGLDPSLFGLK